MSESVQKDGDDATIHVDDSAPWPRMDNPAPGVVVVGRVDLLALDSLRYIVVGEVVFCMSKEVFETSSLLSDLLLDYPNEEPIRRKCGVFDSNRAIEFSEDHGGPWDNALLMLVFECVAEFLRVQDGKPIEYTTSHVPGNGGRMIFPAGNAVLERIILCDSNSFALSLWNMEKFFNITIAHHLLAECMNRRILALTNGLKPQENREKICKHFSIVCDIPPEKQKLIDEDLEMIVGPYIPAEWGLDTAK